MTNPSLTSQEKESCIIWNEADKMAEVATYNPRWQRAIEKMGIKPFEVDEIGGCRFYLIPKARLPLPRAARRLSEEQKTKLVAALKGGRGQPKKGATKPTAQGPVAPKKGSSTPRARDRAS